MTRIRAIVYGLGTMGRLTTKFLRDKDVQVVAAYMRRTAGKDFSAPELQGVAICTPDVPFESHGADVVLMTHCTTLADLYEPAMQAAAAGLNVLTIAEEAFDPFYPDRETPKARALDAAFRSHGVTLASLGVQDAFWFVQPLGLLTAVQRLDRLTCTNICDLSMFGTVGAHGEVLDLTAEDFAARGHAAPSGHRGIFEVALRPLIRAIGARVTAVKVWNEPLLAEAEMQPRPGLTIRAGHTRGFAERAVFTLDTGITVEGRFVMAYLPPGESAHNEWRVEGLPAMNLRTDDFQGDVITCAALVNRLADVIAAPPGFLAVDQLPVPGYRHRF